MRSKKALGMGLVLFIVSAVSMGFNVIPVSASNGNVVVNGSFEVPAVTHPASWNNYTSIPGWTVEWMPTVPATWNIYSRPSEAYIELQRERDPPNGRETPYGVQWAELDSDWSGPDVNWGDEPSSIAIYQDLTTVAGGVYSLSFAYSPRPNEANNRLIAKWDGTVVADISASGGSTVQWTVKTVASLTATSSTTRLRFEEAGSHNSRGMFLDAVCVTLMEIPVDIDIKPGSWPNSFSVKKRGLIPVAIFGTASVDVTCIRPESIRLGGISVAQRGSSGKLAVSYEDVDSDGTIDMVVFFNAQEVIQNDPINGIPGTYELTLTGTLCDGTGITGTDYVRVVGGGRLTTSSNPIVNTPIPTGSPRYSPTTPIPI